LVSFAPPAMASPALRQRLAVPAHRACLRLGQDNGRTRKTLRGINPRRRGRDLETAPLRSNRNRLTRGTDYLPTVFLRQCSTFEEGSEMVRLTLLAVSSVLALSTVPVLAQTPGDVLQGIGRQMNGEPVYRDHYWRDLSAGALIGTSSAHSTRAAARCTTNAGSTRKTGFTAADPCAPG
jgi:hypothetical protein